MNKELSMYLKYNKDTGDLVWIKSTSNRVVLNKPISCINKRGYLVVRFKNKLYTVHRVIWFLYYKEIPKVIDHINGNKLDNRIVNLRNVNNLENSHNHGLNNKNKSGKCGVSFCNYYNKWVSYIDINGKRKNLGYSVTYENAIEKRKLAEIKYYGYEIRG